jgi:DNA replication protein DnaC
MENQQNQQPQLSQVKLKISDLSSYDIAKKIFWKHANILAKKELKSEFEFDSENNTTVAAFVAYFTNNFEEMQKYQIDPRKGIMIFGNPGSGKSMLFRILRSCLQSETVVEIGEREFKERSFFQKSSLLTCEHMAKLYMAKGEVELHKYGQNAVITINGDTHCHNACFDDLGAEEIRNNFGNLKEVMVDLIVERYDLFLQYGLKTHFTTNLDPTQIKKRYKDRVSSRLRQMCNLLAIGTEETYRDRR